MGNLVSDADIAFLHSLYPSAGLAPLSSQCEKFILLRCSGLTNPQAEKAVGYAKGTGVKMMARDDVRIVYEYLKETKFTDVRITRERITTMFLDAHAHAVTSTEEVLATKELAKLHDLYEDEINKRAARTGAQTVVNVEGDLNLKQIGKMSDDELAAVAGVIDLDPENYTVIHNEELERNAAELEAGTGEPGRPTVDTEYVPPGIRSARARTAASIVAGRGPAADDGEGPGAPGPSAVQADDAPDSQGPVEEIPDA